MCLKHHFVISFTLNYQLQNHFDGLVCCKRVNGVSVTASAPLSLVSALCPYSERVGSQCYTSKYQLSSHNIVMM